MNTQPIFLKSLIFIAVTIFIIAAIYKFTSVDNSEQVTVPTVQVESKANFKKRTKHEDKVKKATPLAKPSNDFATSDNAASNPDEITITPEIKQNLQQQREASQKAIYQALFFKTPEDIIKAIDAARKQGNTAQESEYIDLLLTKFPEYNH